MTAVATLLLLVAMPFLLWPLLRPAEPQPSAPAPSPPARDELLHQVEELELDLASGRLDLREADRRLAELRAAR